MLDQTRIIRADIYSLAKSYNHYAEVDVHFDERAKFQAALDTRILAYGAGINDYGAKQLAPHMLRAATILRAFCFESLEKTQMTCDNLFEIFKHHDIGKTDEHYKRATIWTLDRAPTPEEKADQKRHAELGPKVIDDVLKQMEASTLFRQSDYILALKGASMYHHERLDGEGPQGLKDSALGPIMKTMCVVDAYDGDLIPRQQQIDRGEIRTPESVVLRLYEDQKYHGGLDPVIINAFRAFLPRLQELEVEFAKNDATRRPVLTPSFP